MSVGIIMFWIAIATVVIMLFILKFKVNPTIALVIGAVVLGAGTNVGLAKTAVTIGTGFGNLMIGLGLPIGFGVILGKLLSVCGACRVIAQTMIRGAGKKYILYAIAFTGFIISIPVFQDVAFIILVPLCIEISKEMKVPLPYTVGPVTIGTLITHFLVPPTPAPLAAADYFVDLSVGDMVLWGSIFGFIMMLITVKLYIVMLDHGFWDDGCYSGEPIVEKDSVIPAKEPSFIASLFPIVLPVILLVMSTFTSALGIDNDIINFISNRNIAMMFGALAAYVVAATNMNANARDKAAIEAMGDSGTVMLVTGAGGSFAAVISATGLSTALADALSASGSVSPIAILLVAYGIGLVFRVSLGSGTTASITSMSIISGVLAASGAQVGGLWCALACLAGSMSIPHVNDSGFWVTTNLSGYTIKGGLKTYTTIAMMLSIQTLIIALIGGVFF